MSANVNRNMISSEIQQNYVFIIRMRSENYDRESRERERARERERERKRERERERGRERKETQHAVRFLRNFSNTWDVIKAMKASLKLLHLNIIHKRFEWLFY